MAAVRKIVREAGAEINRESQEARKPIYPVLTITGSLAFGWFLIWVVKLDWVLDLMAGVFLLAVGALGILAGRTVYRLLSTSLYHWERIAIAVILGIAVAIAFAELTHSHKLIRYYEHYSNNGDD